MSTLTCHCGCNVIDTDPARGDSVCTACGTVLENIIVSEVQFEETAGGGTSAIGQFVPTDGQRCTIGGSNRYKLNRDSKTQTLAKARKSIERMADQIRAKPYIVDIACRFFAMALRHRFTSGRKSEDVVAACLYVACRQEKQAIMLLDLSEVLRKNVYTIGRTYLDLAELLNISKDTLIDPSWYISRFAYRLGLGSQKETEEVIKTATRLVNRMKHDYIHIGRRPAGICGAALLVAARNHDFSVTIKDIINVVKVCEATMKKRLTEFGDTPSSHLTPSEFMSIHLEQAQDPPSFKNRLKKAKILAQKENDPDILEKVTKFQREIELALDKQRKKCVGFYAKYAKYAKIGENSSEGENNDQENNEETIDSIKEFLDSENLAALDGDVDATLNDDDDSNLFLHGLRPTPESLGLNKKIEDGTEVDKPADEESGELDLTGIDDEEIDFYIMNEAEVKSKTDIWNQLNADYLKEAEEREAKEKEENVGKPEKKKRKRERKQTPSRTAEESVGKMLKTKRICNKINYDVLFSITNSDVQKDSQELTKPRSPFVSPTLHDTPLAKRMASVIFKEPETSNTPENKSRSQRLPSLSTNKRSPMSDQDKNKGFWKTIAENNDKLGNDAQNNNDTSDVILETEPIVYDENEDHEENIDEEEDDENISTAKLLGRTDDECDYDYDEYNDYNDYD